MTRTRPAGIVAALSAVVSLGVACGGGGGGGPLAPSQSSSTSSISAVRGWTGTLEILANLSGSGSSSFAGMNILENYTHDSTARLNVSLTRDQTVSTLWAGTAQGAVTIRNQNTMTMVAPGGILTCTGTLAWIGDDPLFSTTVRVEADSNGATIRLYLARIRIPAPDSGSVICPTTGLSFPTTDPNSPFAPTELLSGLPMTPTAGASQSLFAFTTAPGDSGIGGFVASPARIPYTINLNLTAVP